ncbi:MAG: glycogen-binding domain-containing protein [Candidatus Omnitrophica bacterium]|nr:glycogen-binding domain-containing protein [Candidatus Omnitrophota bacterium]
MAKVTKAKFTVFKIYAPQAKKVYLAGSFNNWNPKTISAKKDKSGNWTAKVDLRPGRYEYKFIVDGNWTVDPCASAYVTNNFGTQNSVIEIK